MAQASQLTGICEPKFAVTYITTTIRSGYTQASVIGAPINMKIWPPRFIACPLYRGKSKADLPAALYVGGAAQPGQSNSNKLIGVAGIEVQAELVLASRDLEILLLAALPVADAAVGLAVYRELNAGVGLKRVGQFEFACK